MNRTNCHEGTGITSNVPSNVFYTTLLRDELYGEVVKFFLINKTLVIFFCKIIALLIILVYSKYLNFTSCLSDVE